MKYPQLFQRAKIGKLELKNRIVMPAMGTGFAMSTGEVSEHMIRYYEERAKSGCGLIITEIARIDEEYGVGFFNQLCVTHPRQIAQLERLANTIHKYDSKIFVQLHHPGRSGRAIYNNGRQVVAPSPIICNVIREMPRELSTEECAMLVKKFVNGAVLAKKALIDGVEIHGAHGYLVNQFLSPYSNKRTDKYGGSFQNRMRFLTEIIMGIRATCGKDFPIIVRISADEFVEGGLTLSDSVEIAKYLENLGIDAINVSCGIHETGATTMESYNYEQGWKKSLAKKIHENVTIPVIAVNNIKEPRIAEQLLKEEVCDFIALGRAQLADPYWVAKAYAGEEYLIHNCLGCMYCFKELVGGRKLKCAVNPRLGRELEFATLPQDGHNRIVAVIGGGPAGMSAAAVLAQRGFAVHIFEKESKLGGTLNLADRPPHKELITLYKQALEAELKTMDIQIHLNTETDVTMIKELNPYAVFLAVGGKTIVPDLPGINSAIVYQAEEIISGKMSFSGKDITVIGGGITGLETAEMVAENNRVTVVEMQREIATDVYPTLAGELLKSLVLRKVNILLQHQLLAIEGQEITLKSFADDREITRNTDAVVLALGVNMQDDLFAEFSNTFANVKILGDAAQSGCIAEAVRDGFTKAFVLQ